MSQNVDTLVADLLGKELTLARDYASIVNWSISQIEKWTDQWTDYTITDPGILFINADGFMYDMINYVLDEAYLNNILRHTRSMESLYFMSKFVGLELPSYTASRAKVKVENPFKTVIKIPEDYPIYVKDKATGEEIWFYADKEYTIPSNSFDYIYMIEGKRTTINTTFGNFDEHFTFVIPLKNVATNAVFVWTKPLIGDSYQKLNRVDDAFLNTTGLMCYSVHFGYDHIYIKFPPGTKGYLNSNSQVKIVYGVTEGSKANLGVVKALPGTTLLEGGVSIEGRLSFTIMYAEDGADPLSLEDTRIFIGNNSWRVESLIVTDDFNQLAKSKFPEIIRFVPVQEQGKEQLRLFFVPVTGLSSEKIDALRTEVYREARPKMFGGTRLTVSEINYVRITFQFEVTLGTNSSDTTQIVERVNKLLTTYFDRTTQPEKMALRRSAIIALLEDEIFEIDNVSCISPTSDMVAKETEIFELAGVSVKFIQKGR